MDWLARTIALIAATIALITAVIGWQRDIHRSSELTAQKAELTAQKAELTAQQVKLEDIKNCRGEIVIRIDNPRNGDHVSLEEEVIGTGTIHETCRYIFIFVRDVSKPAWKVTDLVQVNTDGQWAGQARLDGFVPVGGEANIEARGMAQPNAYMVGDMLPAPPERGVPSNIVRVRRKQ